jgi:predicted AAA+ superfamily ATPase
MLKRKLYYRLLKWKNVSKGSTALLIKGARRVGKSYLCQQFGKQEYKSTLFIDFGNVTDEVIQVFESERQNLDLFFSKLSILYQTQLYERESLVVFDEVQQYPKARQMIKYLVADGRFDYIETGSLLSIKENVKDIIIPSEEEHIEMYPLDFEEFLWAMGDQVTIPFIFERFQKLEPLGQGIHTTVMNHFRQYLLVGGMPQVVTAYMENRDFAIADRTKRTILNLYRSDISRFANGYEGKVSAVFDTIPSQLSKTEKKFKLSSINKNARTKYYEDTFIWLKDAMIVNPCYNTTDPNIGLALSSDFSTQKIYMQDTGLLVTHAFWDNNFVDNQLYRALLFDKLSINEGMITENIVAQMLKTNGHQLYFYSRTDKGNPSNTMEIDFLLTRNNKMSPVEVKSASYRTHSSLDKFRQKYSRRIGESYILYSKDVMVRDNVVHLPLYMAMFL